MPQRLLLAQIRRNAPWASQLCVRIRHYKRHAILEYRKRVSSLGFQSSIKLSFYYRGEVFSPLNYKVTGDVQLFVDALASGQYRQVLRKYCGTSPLRVTALYML